MKLLLAGVVTTAIVVAAAPQGSPQYRASSDIVEVYATVKLKNGAIARDLTQDDFELRDDGRPAPIAVFSRSIQPLSVALVLDHSGSTNDEFGNVREAAQEFLAHLIVGDRASIGTLSWDCQPFTDDQRALSAALEQAMPTDRGSPIWAATNRAMEALAPEGGRRIVLLFSDGQDNQRMQQRALGRMAGPPPRRGGPPGFGFMTSCVSAGLMDLRTAADVRARAEREAVMIYTVSVGSSTGELDGLAKQTGASHQKLGNYGQLRMAFRSIADELHLQYLLGFAPSFTDGKPHKIDVRATRAGVTVQARKSYTAASVK